MIRAGQKLYEERIKKGLSLEDVEKGTKIKSTFIAAIEKGQYNLLPSSAYAQGFVRNYAEFLGLPEKGILALFRREFDEKKIYKVLPESMSRSHDIAGRSMRIRRTVVAFILLFIIFLSFIIYQFRFAIINPPLEIDAPKENIATGQEITVAGKSDANATVTINDQPATVSTNGEFMKRIRLFPGQSIITIKAKSRFGKETTIQRIVNVK